MPFKIIDNKKIEMTEDEFTMYRNIVNSYTTATNKGEDLFFDLFEVNEEGIIIYLKPPSKRSTTLEAYLFVMSLMVHQHLRRAIEQTDALSKELKDKINLIDSLSKRIELLENKDK